MFETVKDKDGVNFTVNIFKAKFSFWRWYGEPMPLMVYNYWKSGRIHFWHFSVFWHF